MDMNWIKNLGLGGPPVTKSANPSGNGLPQIQANPTIKSGSSLPSDTFVRSTDLSFAGTNSKSKVQDAVNVVSKMSLSDAKAQLNPQTASVMTKAAENENYEFPPLEGDKGDKGNT